MVSLLLAGRSAVRPATSELQGARHQILCQILKSCEINDRARGGLCEILERSFVSLLSRGQALLTCCIKDVFNHQVATAQGIDSTGTSTVVCLEKLLFEYMMFLLSRALAMDTGTTT